MKKIVMSMSTWTLVFLCILCMPTLANALERFSVPDARIFWLLGPVLIFLGFFGKKRNKK